MSRVDKPNMMVNNQEGKMSFKSLISTTWAQHDPPGSENKKDMFDEHTMAWCKSWRSKSVKLILFSGPHSVPNDILHQGFCTGKVIQSTKDQIGWKTKEEVIWIESKSS